MDVKDLDRAPRKLAIALLGISAPQFTRLTQAGVFTKEEHGIYNLKKIVGQWVRYHLDGKSSGDHAAEKRLLTIAQRKKHELDIAERERELVSLQEAEDAFTESMVIVASQLDGLPGRGAMELAGMSDPAMVRAWLFEETRRIRDAAADRLEEFFSGAEGSGRSKTTTTAERGSVGGSVSDTPKRKRGAGTVEK